MLKAAVRRNAHWNPVAEVRDLDRVASLLRVHHASIWQLEPGRLYALYESLVIGRLQFLRTRFSLAVRLGFDRLNESFVVVPGDRGPAPRVMGVEVPPDSVVVCHGDQEADTKSPFELVIPASVSVTFIELGRDFLSDMSRRGRKCGSTETATILPDRGREVSEIVERSFRAAAEGATHAIPAREIELRVLDIVLGKSRARDAVRATRLTNATRAVAIIERLVSNYLATHEPVSVVEMCRVTGLSRRGLTYAFQERYGVPPKRFFRTLALNDVRRELISSDGSGRVSDIAPFYGFWHMSQFAADYKTQFGELPSETLSRARRVGKSRAVSVTDLAPPPYPNDRISSDPTSTHSRQ